MRREREEARREISDEDIRFNFQVMPERIVGEGVLSNLIPALTSCAVAITASMERHNTIMFRIDRNLARLAERKLCANATTQAPETYRWNLEIDIVL